MIDFWNRANMGQTQGAATGGQGSSRTPLDKDTLRRDWSRSLVAKFKERSASFEQQQEQRGDYVVGLGHYVLRPNIRVEAFDVWRSKVSNKLVYRWRPARIRKMHEDSVLVAFDGFSERWDAWFPLKEGKLRSPTGGPVVGPDGVLYSPRLTPDEYIYHGALQPSQEDLTAKPPVTLIQSQDSGESKTESPPQPIGAIHEQGGEIVKKKKNSTLSLQGRRPSLLFKKLSRSSDEDTADENNVDEGNERSSDPIPAIEEEDYEEEMEITISLDGDDDELDNRGSARLLTMKKRINRTISSTSSLVVETGDISPPSRGSTPPSLRIYQLPFLRRSNDANKKAILQQQQQSSIGAPNTIANCPSVSDLGGTDSTSATYQKENSGAWTPQQLQNRGLSGLVNLGNTCYMNAVLQSLSHIAPLVEKMLIEVQPMETIATTTEQALPTPPPPPPRPSLIRSDRLARALCTLLRDQWKPTAEKTRRPDELKRLLGEIAPQFQGYRQHDAQELLVCLLDGLHECLNKIRRRPTYVEINPPKGVSDEDLSYYYWDNYERGNDSFIKDMFCGQLMSKVTCSVCNTVSTSFDVFWDLSLPIPAQEKPVALSDLLAGFCAEEEMDPDCGFRCEQCKTPTQQAMKKLTVAKYPKVLVLHLKRFSHETNGTKKIGTPVSFPLKGLMCEGEMYDLIGVVNHFGSFLGGHYTADVFNPLSKTWYNADDSNFNPAAKVGSNAYLLFYVENTRSERAVKTLTRL